jgi:hypothetical protein
LSFGKSCEERLDDVEELLRNFISRDGKGLALGNMVKGAIETTVRQQLETRWQHFERAMKETMEAQEARLKKTEDILGALEARLTRFEEMEEKSNGESQNNVNPFEKQKTMIERLEARIIVLEKNNGFQTMFQNAEENEIFTASQVNLKNLPKTSVLQKGFKNADINSKQFFFLG